MPGPKQYRIRNWTEFQHYKDRNPPWIKLHFALLASEDWVSLDDASKLLAVVCMLVGSRNEGLVANNPAYLKRVAYLDTLPDLEPLVSCGFLEIPQADASATQAVARPETEERREEQTVKSVRKAKPTPTKSKASRYLDGFEEFWRDYPTTPTMSKKLAAAEWQKLADADRAACHGAVPAFKAYLADQKPDHTTLHAVRFISQRRFEGFAPPPDKPLTDEDWLKRLRYARDKKQWDSDRWGPLPGADGCLVPVHLQQQGDGKGWEQWKA
jgi:hypothetical protein